MSERRCVEMPCGGRGRSASVATCEPMRGRRSTHPKAAELSFYAKGVGGVLPIDISDGDSREVGEVHPRVTTAVTLQRIGRDQEQFEVAPRAGGHAHSQERKIIFALFANSRMGSTGPISRKVTPCSVMPVWPAGQW